MNSDLELAWEKLSPFLTENRKQRLIDVAKNRTKHLRLVLEHVHDPHNISACLRSADAFGIHEVDIISLDFKKFKPSTTAKGTQSWLRINHFKNSQECLHNLKQLGYKIGAGFPPQADQKVYELSDLAVSEPLALIFGNEHKGLSPEWTNWIDYKFSIPMVGMVESLNISVSAAITMYSLRQKLDQITTEQNSYLLSDAQQTQLLNNWILNQFKDPEEMIKKIIQKEGQTK